MLACFLQADMSSRLNGSDANISGMLRVKKKRARKSHGMGPSFFWGPWFFDDAGELDCVVGWLTRSCKSGTCLSGNDWSKHFVATPRGQRAMAHHPAVVSPSLTWVPSSVNMARRVLDFGRFDFDQLAEVEKQDRLKSKQD